jgi:predicted DCC family thiol-disulfide oxidoreductase YuxK
LINHHLSAEDLSTFLFIENNKIYTKSIAALKVCRYLKGLWPLLYGFIIVPEFIRNGIYNLIAKNRYQWFGKKEVCMIPSADVRSRFLN